MLRCVALRCVALCCVVLCIDDVSSFFVILLSIVVLMFVIKDSSGTGQALLVHFTHTSVATSVDVSDICLGVDHGNTGSCFGFGL